MSPSLAATTRIFFSGPIRIGVIRIAPLQRVVAARVNGPPHALINSRYRPSCRNWASPSANDRSSAWPSKRRCRRDRSRLARRRERPPNRPAARRPRHRCADIRLAPAPAQPAEARLAIRPIPSEFEKTVHARDGRALTLRPIRPEDEPALQAFVLRQSPEDRRLRFFLQVKELNHQVAARLTQIDCDREMAFVLIDRHAEKPAVLGLMSIFADPEGARAEYAGAVRSDLKGRASAACSWRKSSSAASAAASARFGTKC
jgi:hypothetical protein